MRCENCLLLGYVEVVRECWSEDFFFGKIYFFVNFFFSSFSVGVLASWMFYTQSIYRWRKIVRVPKLWHVLGYPEGVDELCNAGVHCRFGVVPNSASFESNQRFSTQQTEAALTLISKFLNSIVFKLFYYVVFFWVVHIGLFFVEFLVKQIVFNQCLLV